jgi:hypothetical protein
MPAERLHGAEDHGLSADLAILLGPPGTGAKPASGCDKNGCGTLRFGHLDSNTNESGLRRGRQVALAHSPYHAEYGKQSDSHHLWESGFCCSALAQMIDLSKV